MIALSDIVRLKKPIPEKQHEAGARGTVIFIHEEENLPLAYMVEFIDKNGDILVSATVEANE